MSDIEKVMAEEWEVSQSGDYVMAPGDYTVCWVGWTSPAELVRAKARARIIAAAPEALRLLIEVGSYFGACVREAPEICKEEARHLAKINALLAALREDAA